MQIFDKNVQIMQKKRPIWIAIGKEQNKLETRSQLIPYRKRNLSNSHSQVTDATSNSLVKIRSAKQLFFRQSVQQGLRASILEPNEQKVEQISINIISEDKKWIEKLIQNNKQQVSKQQQQVKAMSHNHVPFYLRNQDYKVHYQMQPSERSRDESHFDEEMNESVVLEAEDLQVDLNRVENSNRGMSSNIPDEQSEIIEAMSFASSSNHQQAMNIRAPIVHYERGYRDGNEMGNPLIKNIKTKYEDPYQNKKSKFEEKIKLQLNQLNEMTENLRIIQQTIVKEIIACQSSGKLPIFTKNQQIYSKMLSGFKEIMAQQIRLSVQKQSQRSSQSISKLLNAVIQRNLLTDSTFKQLNNQQKIQKIINTLQQKSSQVTQLQQKLTQAQLQCDKTSAVLLNKLEEINELKQQLFKQKQNEKSNISMASQNTATFSPQFEKLLREKDSRGNEMLKEIQELKERNQQLMDDKEKLQQQVFTLQQKIIGVEMQVQQRVRQGIQEIRPVMEEQMRSEYKVDEKQKQTAGNNEFFLQTIDTLSQQIKDLTQKCKYYEKYIRDQQKNQPSQSPKPTLHQQQQQSKDYEQIIGKRMAELQMRESTLLTIQNELTFKDKKLKELQNRLTKEATQFEKRQRLCVNKEEEIEKYLQQLNAREEELYVWEKQLDEEDKKLTRKTNELQREKALYQNQKLNSVPMMNPYQMNQVAESRNIMSPYSNQQYQTHYPNSAMQKQQISSLQNQESFRQDQHRMLYERPYTYQPGYQATYEDEPSYHPNHRGFEKNHHNYSQQNIRYNHLNDSEDIKSPQMRLDHSDLDISQLRQNRISQKQKTESMRVRGGELGNSNGEHNYSKVSQYRPGNQKLYLSSTYDKKSQMVEQILAKRRNENFNHRNQRPQSRSPISVNRNPLNDVFKKSEVRRIKSPLRNDSSFHTLKDITQRKLKERYERKRMFQKPSKDMPDGYRPMTMQGLNSPTSFTVKKYPYDASHQLSGVSQKQYTPRSFMKSSMPAAHNINQKLQKLKQEIKREVRDLD